MAWRESHSAEASQTGHRNWLRCALPWLSRDTDGDGTPDWSALVSGRPSTVLIPFDEDIDGDGLPNLLDAAPFRADITRKQNIRVEPTTNEVPRHLRLAGAARAPQAALYREFGVLAIDHTDSHVAEALTAALDLLRLAVPRGLVGPGSSVRVLYAFKGHDLRHEIAAYHRELGAISVAGRQSIPPEFSARDRSRWLAAFAHELGHAFVFDRLGGMELDRVAGQFGGWQAETHGNSPDLLSAPFFRAHPLRRFVAQIPETAADALRFTEDERLRQVSLVSQYAADNPHEWFAEAFAAHLLKRLQQNRTTPLSKPDLVFLPNSRGDYWVNYHNLASGLDGYLAETLKRLH